MGLYSSDPQQPTKRIIRVIDNYSIVVCDVRSFSVKSYRLPTSLVAANYLKFVKTIHPFIPRGVGEIPKGSIFASLLRGRKLNTDVLLLHFFLDNLSECSFSKISALLGSLTIIP